CPHDATPTPRPTPLSLHDALPSSPPPPAGWCSSTSKTTPTSSTPAVANSSTPTPSTGTPNTIRTPQRVRVCVTSTPCSGGTGGQDRKSTRLNSSHVKISYAVFCLK